MTSKAFVPRPIEDHPAIGRRIKYSFQPYHNGEGMITRVRTSSREGCVSFTLRVEEGGETSRLFQYSSTKSNKGSTLSATGVSERSLMEAIERGSTFVYVYPL